MLIQNYATSDVDALVNHLKQAIDKENMRLVAHINGQANAAKLGKQVPADQILEIFRPDFAMQVWRHDKRAGIEIPVRIHIYATPQGAALQCRMPSELFAAYNNNELNLLGEQLDLIFNSIIRSLEGFL